jgi:hypothetical protein
MQKRQDELSSVDQFIMRTVKKKQPDTVQELVELVRSKLDISEQEIMNHILNLQDKGKLDFRDQTASPLLTFKGYIISTNATWYWTIIALAFATITVVFTVPVNAFPMVYTRYVLGFIFVLFLPGFCLIKVLYPTKELDNMERIVLSIGTSLAIVPIIGLLLYYTPWGINTTPVTLSLLALTMTLATAAVIREYTPPKEKQQN